MITYFETPENKTDRLPITVKLDGKTVGHIIRVNNRHESGYRYRPKGANRTSMFGDVMESIEAVKASIETQ